MIISSIIKQQKRRALHMVIYHGVALDCDFNPSSFLVYFALYYQLYCFFLFTCFLLVFFLLLSLQ